MKERKKQYEKLSPEYKRKFIEVLEDLQSGNTDHLDIKYFGEYIYRCRVGKYRIIYKKDQTIEILKI